MLKVIAYTGSPSGTFRVRQYLQPLRTMGIEMRENASWCGSHPPGRKWLRPVWGVSNLGERAIDTARSFAYDMVFFQREMLSTFVTWEPLTKKPRILDVDDAIFAHHRGRFAERLARCCDHVICGNKFLADQFSCWNPNVTILPTAVDIDRFCPAGKSNGGGRPVIGWMGLPIGFDYLYQIEGALSTVLRRYPEAVFRLVSSRMPNFQKLPAQQTQWIPWTAENEARTIQEMTIGIMPLDETVGSRGKCSYKMLLYMACGIPVVVSPVGMNADVLEQGNVGYGASTEEEWIDRLSRLIEEPGLGFDMGKLGREIVVKNYSVQALAPQLGKTLLEVAGKTS